MIFEDPSRRYPYLVQALNILSRRNPPVPPESMTGAGVGIAGVALLAAGAMFGFWLFLVSGAILVAISVAYFVGKRRMRSALPPPDPRLVEATAVAQSMIQMLAKRRLHRDIDPGSLILLEECARHWSRARTALEGPFWTAGNVPLHYQSVRSQALTALDESMDEVLLHYRAWVPDEVPNRHALDYVDEALEQFAMKNGRRSSAGFIPPQFTPVREIAEKLRSLADEAERMAREVRVDPEVAAQFAPGRSLDQTLSELRQIREAEEELRQNLRG